MVLEISKIWPSAPIYTTCYDPEVLPRDFPKERLILSFIQRIPFQRRLYRHFFFLHPLAFERFNFNEYDVVISSTTRFAKSIITQPQTLHICYCNTPPRFLWNYEEYISHRDFNILFRPLYRLVLPFLIHYLRLHDYIAAQKVDYFIANSKNVARRIEKFYGRESVVIYPFVELERFGGTRIKQIDANETNKYYLIVSRLGGHKRVDLAIEAFNKLGLPLKIIGQGPEEGKYRRMINKNIEILSGVSDEEVVEYHYQSIAFIYPQLEDFGITALEAMAAGKPVIAYRGGGALETIVEGETGEFFHPQHHEALVKIVKHFDHQRYDGNYLRSHAARFSKARFQKGLKEFVEEKYNKGKHEAF